MHERFGHSRKPRRKDASGNDATLDSISVTPSGADVTLGSRLQFSANGHFSDGTILGLTNQVTWTSSDATVAVITPKGGFVSTSRPGIATIDATLDRVTGGTTLTVH